MGAGARPGDGKVCAGFTGRGDVLTLIFASLARNRGLLLCSLVAQSSQAVCEAREKETQLPGLAGGGLAYRQQHGLGEAFDHCNIAIVECERLSREDFHNSDDFPLVLNWRR
jgi:hypothetical protein